MKVKAETLPPPPTPWTPKRLVIDFESQDELIAFRHLVGCWCTQTSCTGDLQKTAQLAHELRAVACDREFV